jgi:hypothetical protein
MFDQSKEFLVKILSGTEKACTVRYPSDEDWCARTRAQRAIRRLLGRGKSQYEVAGAEEADAELLGKIRLDKDGVELDAAEAAKVIERLERCQVLDAERAGDRFRIEMRVAGGRVVHVLKIATQKDVLDYGRASVRAVDGRRQQEIRLALEPAAELWAKVRVAVEGYANPETVPIVHKDVAVVELLAQVEALQEEDDPEE